MEKGAPPKQELNQEDMGKDNGIQYERGRKKHHDDDVGMAGMAAGQLPQAHIGTKQIRRHLHKIKFII